MEAILIVVLGISVNLPMRAVIHLSRSLFCSAAMSLMRQIHPALSGANRSGFDYFGISHHSFKFPYRGRLFGTAHYRVTRRLPLRPLLAFVAIPRLLVLVDCGGSFLILILGEW